MCKSFQPWSPLFRCLLTHQHMQEGSETDPLGYTQTRPICSLWFVCDNSRYFEVPSQASNCLSFAQIPDPFHLYQVVYTGHYEFPFKAPKQELTLFRIKTFPLVQSSTLRQHRSLGEQPHHCHHLLLSESHQDLTGLMAMPCIQSAATVRNTCFRRSIISSFSHKLSVPMVPVFLSSKLFPFKISSWTLLHSHVDILFSPKCSRIDKVTWYPNKIRDVSLPRQILLCCEVVVLKTYTPIHWHNCSQ